MDECKASTGFVWRTLNSESDAQSVNRVNLKTHGILQLVWKQVTCSPDTYILIYNNQQSMCETAYCLSALTAPVPCGWVACGPPHPVCILLPAHVRRPATAPGHNSMGHSGTWPAAGEGDNPTGAHITDTHLQWGGVDTGGTRGGYPRTYYCSEWWNGKVDATIWKHIVV